MERRVLVTGATGFIGPSVARELAAQGYAVAALVRGERPQQRLDERGIPAEARPGDLLDSASLASAVRDVDAVIHVAALVDIPEVRNEAQQTALNRDATLELARLACEAGVKRFVFLSSIAAMGMRPGLASADSRCEPINHYGWTKLQAERGLEQLSSTGFEVFTLRAPTVYGPGERLNFLRLVRAIDRGFFRVIGDGRNVFPLATPVNVARAVAAAADGLICGRRAARGLADGRPSAGIYLVADREPYSMNRIVSAIARALGRRPPRLRIPEALARALGFVNEAAAARLPGVPLLLSRGRVTTLSVNQPFDVGPLLRAGVPLDAPLEEWVKWTIADYDRRGLLGSAGARR